MTSSTRDRWLGEGIAVLCEQGAAGVRIDRLAARLGLSKGSFHHHFEGIEGYRSALLLHAEQRIVNALDDAVRGHRDQRPRAVLQALTSLTTAPETSLYDPRLEAAIRAWAFADAEARDVVARVDAARLTTLEQIWRRVVPAPANLRAHALLPYLIGLGASVLVPAPGPAELRSVYDILLGLVPDDLEES
ncbi:TetR family transcriptional regulator [Sphaerisporangium rufum]|uniref:TetR family transcriptional regulator n=1 Tax=Sphaerisporangium rufum TaxID=1381558 RepID=A0A919R968_9ACTN|nr:TetR/AcrR family transcriptional regulator [Sphaerisporangium rufum]GII81894.1 TetR family transcriptional regulator [Sphaerisporangium rufum]